MSKSKIPNPMVRRYLIEKDLDEAHCLAIADAYEADGRVTEAIVFLVKAGAGERLAALADRAVAQGDAFLLKAVADASGTAVNAERWLELATAAEAAGMQRYVTMARRHARSSEGTSD